MSGELVIPQGTHSVEYVSERPFTLLRENCYASLGPIVDGFWSLVQDSWHPGNIVGQDCCGRLLVLRGKAQNCPPGVLESSVVQPLSLPFGLFRGMLGYER